MTQEPRLPAQPAGAPEPEPIRWFGTSWVERDGGYRLRRVLVPVGALLAAAAAALLLRFAVDGIRIAGNGGFLNGLLVAAVAICSLLAALRTWKLLTEGKESLTGWMAEDRSLGVVWVIGGVGALLAYFVRSLREAPGEAVRRAHHERELDRYERRQAGRSGRPGARTPGRAKRRR
ncbi:membrane protein [Kitasatospora putterlickiae]|uniref:Membrane protein n=1 Tax=Kitasatospora putterlickiae TaxID=221725 RepID=A0ABP4ICW9_9ACTN